MKKLIENQCGLVDDSFYQKILKNVSTFFEKNIKKLFARNYAAKIEVSQIIIV